MKGLPWKTSIPCAARAWFTTRECKNPYSMCGVLDRNVSKHSVYQDKVIPTSFLACSGLEWLQQQGKMLTCHFSNGVSCNLEWQG